jgi:hypothetical protein
VGKKKKDSGRPRRDKTVARRVVEERKGDKKKIRSGGVL